MNKEERKEYYKKYYQENKEKINKHNKEYRQDNKEKINKHNKEYHQNNKEKIKERVKKYYENNKEKIKEYCQKNKKNRNKYEKNRRKADFNFKILTNIRNRIRSAIKTNAKSSSTKELLGCSIEEVQKHLESKFTPGMSWDNWGSGDDKWHIDHIIPCASFNMLLEEDQKKCFHFSNLQPLWQKDNLSKGKKIEV